MTAFESPPCPKCTSLVRRTRTLLEVRYLVQAQQRRQDTTPFLSQPRFSLQALLVVQTSG